MRALLDVIPTAEQLALFSRIRTGTEIIRGAAGSGKTTTALLKLRAAVGFYLNRQRRMKDASPVRVLVLTFNRTLRGYVAELANRQIASGDEVILEIDTFSRWAKGLLGNPEMIEHDESEDLLSRGAGVLNLPVAFVREEARYVMERFLPNDLPTYLGTRRDGRGTMPRMERSTRETLLDQVIYPYLEYKQTSGKLDWNDLAIRLASEKQAAYDIVIVDETQDFSANEIRAIMNQLSENHTVTFVLDSTQRIYPRKFNWAEVGVNLSAETSHKLTSNYRNTKQIAQFAASILSGMTVDDDGTIPNFSSASRQGEVPTVITGRFTAQMAFAIQKIKTSIDLSKESVAFLHAKGGRWFNELKDCLAREELPYVSIARKSDWPEGVENIALSTLHSAKGLEFDHIFILGLNAEVVPVDDESSDIPDAEKLNAIRRLVAMGIGRARQTVTIGYKASDAPGVAAFFDDAVCRKIAL
ncbi:3'-5' exonuclease [Hydrogenophaga pseudoflava]|uniref:3'-5' exonuclease n=1 Tax=Hydrogenophaga pseudoflava TaxID=47421 RepID=UPI0009FF6170|nr:3'-5' exonuclease [Hydrogenophaga pseudoflava]